MMTLHFPRPYEHRHKEVVDVSQVYDRERTLGQRAADRVANTVGSWRFIIIQSVLLTAWVIVNVIAWVQHWDPYPFILLNLFMSLQAAYTAPIIMMSQNREAVRDRVEAHHDYEINVKAEEEVRVLMDHLAAQNEALATIYRKLEDLHADLARAAGGSGPTETEN